MPHFRRLALLIALLAMCACGGDVESPNVPTGESSAVTPAVTTGNPTTLLGVSPMDPALLPEALQDERVFSRDAITLAGGSSITLDGSVIGGDRDLYQYLAAGGETLLVTITSAEQNAVFEVYSPDESLMVGRSTEFSTDPLADDGRYLIVVGPTSGNATYTITFEAG